MELKDFKFKITNKKTGESAVLTFDDIYGYEGEDCGVFIRISDNIPDSLSGVAVNHNSGYGFKGLNEDLEIELY